MLSICITCLPAIYPTFINKITNKIILHDRNTFPSKLRQISSYSLQPLRSKNVLLSRSEIHLLDFMTSVKLSSAAQSRDVPDTLQQSFFPWKAYYRLTFFTFFTIFHPRDFPPSPLWHSLLPSPLFVNWFLSYDFFYVVTFFFVVLYVEKKYGNLFRKIPLFSESRKIRVYKKKEESLFHNCMWNIVAIILFLEIFSYVLYIQYHFHKFYLQ